MLKFIQDLFKKPWEKDLVKFLQTTDVKGLEKYSKTLDLSKSKEVDFTQNMWGHGFNFSKTYNDFVHYGLGHYSNFMGPNLRVGDTMLLNTSKGYGIYRVLHVEYFRDPKDMYQAYIACIGIKETH